MPPGFADQPDFSLSGENYDCETLPSLHFNIRADETTVETEEQKIQYRLNPIFRTVEDRANGFIPAWRGPECDRIVML